VSATVTKDIYNYLHLFTHLGLHIH